ncbi:hypothetical protein [Polymorphospora lycopeni]|uniref:Uncharacterized protein n=1 Tax=Polymorphospora lycopeni TaxID=3140240 RepID=A0ABV5CSJ0_9ACTN
MQQVPVVVDDPDTLQRLRRAADGMSTARATQYAISLGVTPPSADPDWELMTRFEADGSEGPLMWVLVSEPLGDK